MCVYNRYILQSRSVWLDFVAMLTPRFSSKRKTEENQVKHTKTTKNGGQAHALPRSHTHGSISPPSPTINQSLPWKEEEEDDAVYIVYLKKVRYRSSVTVLSPQEDISYMLWETVKTKILKAGTLKKLVEHLTPSVPKAMEEDSGFFMAFLCTYKAFATTDQVVDLLLERYRSFKQRARKTEQDEDSADFVMRRICSVLSYWLEHYSSDFDQPPLYSAIHKIIHFASSEVDGIPWKDMLERAEFKLNMLSVTPFDDEVPYNFKLCSCDAVLDCRCGRYSKLAEQNQANILSFSAAEIAEQLTLVDAELFRRVVPRHCLGSFWSKREEAPTIKATIDHFNAVVNCVATTVLQASGLKTKDPQARAKVIKKWVEVTQECRGLKNFSSVKAILSGLQTVAVHRLRRSWSLLSRETAVLYEELSGIFSDDLNQKASRDLLMLEGTAKYATVDGRVSKKTYKKRQSWMKEGVIQGTVPYLGTFLTDLMMIDTAHANKLKNGLINFEKRRKEFEVVAQIKMLQESAKNYNFTINEQFRGWFYSVKAISEEERFQLSKELEPDRACTPQPPRRIVMLKRHLSETDLSKTIPVRVNQTKEPEIPRAGTAPHPRLKHSASSPDRPSTPIKMTLSPPSRNQILPPQGQIARVSIEGSASTDVYKSILLTPNDRTIQVIQSALEKYDMKDSPSNFRLLQVIPGGKELEIPSNANVFYAINKSVDAMFRLSRKKSNLGLDKNRNVTMSPKAGKECNGHIKKERRVGVIAVRAPCPLGHRDCARTCLDTKL